MDSNIFSISEVMLMIDVMREDKVRWSKIGNDKDVLDAYDSIISKLKNGLDDHHGMSRAMEALIDTYKKSD